MPVQINRSWEGVVWYSSKAFGNSVSFVKVLCVTKLVLVAITLTAAFFKQLNPVDSGVRFVLYIPSSAGLRATGSNGDDLVNEYFSSQLSIARFSRARLVRL